MAADCAEQRECSASLTKFACPCCIVKSSAKSRGECLKLTRMIQLWVDRRKNLRKKDHKPQDTQDMSKALHISFMWLAVHLYCQPHGAVHQRSVLVVQTWHSTSCMQGGLRGSHESEHVCTFLGRQPCRVRFRAPLCPRFVRSQRAWQGSHLKPADQALAPAGSDTETHCNPVLDIASHGLCTVDAADCAGPAAVHQRLLDAVPCSG